MAAKVRGGAAASRFQGFGGRRAAGLLPHQASGLPQTL
jgi:hypothetical protein